MASFNKVILIGNFVADPELKQTPTGISVCRFRLAVQRRFVKDQQEQTADFIDIVAWRQTAEFVSRYFKKGRPILVCGQLQSRTWTDKDGGKRYSVEVLADEVSFVESKGSTQTGDAPAQYTPANNYGTPAYSSVPDSNFEEITADDGLPF
ncbi:MAG: single-stranded DNA-binding protein [Clostridia bacterium]|jgi:single-strand DNA-binding protein|nr:single-stranded DNA-binding protein [Clostridia bacterium]MBQ5800325.1 single-stranded DNA-binding protein [Clostridia bacterium]